MTDRRTFLKHAGLLAAALPLGASLAPRAFGAPAADKWTQLQGLFEQDPDYIHFSNFLLTSHPRPVREAIARHRASLDRNPGLSMDLDRQEPWKHEARVRHQAGLYLKANPGQITLTGSTSEGLAMIYAGLEVRPDQEILTSEHEHFSLELVTPLSADCSAGFTFFRVKGKSCDAVAAYLINQRVVTDAVSRDAGPVIRTAPGLLNSEAEVDWFMVLLGKQL